MKIVRDDLKTQSFGTLGIGTVFECLDIIYIKTEEIIAKEIDSEYSYRYNAVQLSSGEFMLIGDQEKVRVFHEAFLTVR